ncbi:MAG: ABC transporter ATP-binding protein, partial [Chloroflexi bacterium]|nr:ABC transporter ATP-binding protein [Chloroflexota bacterium]
EPLGALDLKLRKEMQLELKALQQQLGITFIYVTHDQEEALTMSDRIAVMSKGKIMQMGTSVEVYERPANRFVAEFIGESNFLEGKVKSVKGDQAVVDVPAWGEELIGIATGKVKAGDDVSVSIRPEKVRLTDKQGIKENSLEAVVTTSTYIGSDTHVYLDVRGQRFKVWEQNRISTLDPRAYYANGQKVWVTLLSENTLILPKA